MNQAEQNIMMELVERVSTALEGIATAQLGLTAVAREGLELQRVALLINEQMVSTSKELEDSLIAQLAPKNGGRS